MKNSKLLEVQSIYDSVLKAYDSRIKLLRVLKQTPCAGELHLAESDAWNVKKVVFSSVTKDFGVQNVYVPMNEAQNVMESMKKVNTDDSIMCYYFTTPVADGATVNPLVQLSKDCNGASEASMSFMFSGAGTGTYPCEVTALLSVLQRHQMGLDGQNVVVIDGNALLTKAFVMFLMENNAIVHIVKKDTPNLEKLTQKADIVISDVDGEVPLKANGFNRKQYLFDFGVNAQNSKGAEDVRYSGFSPEVLKKTKGYVTAESGLTMLTAGVMATRTVDKAFNIAMKPKESVE